MIHLNFYRAWYIVGFARKSIGSLGFCWAIHNFGIWVCPATCHRRKKHITVNWQKSDGPLALKNGIPRMVIPWWQDMAHHKPRSHVIQLFHTWPYHQVVMLCHVCEGSIVMLCHHVMPSMSIVIIPSSGHLCAIALLEIVHHATSRLPGAKWLQNYGQNPHGPRRCLSFQD